MGQPEPLDRLAHVNDLGTMSGSDYNWSAFDGIKGVGVPGSFSIQRADVFQYCIFGHHGPYTFNTACPTGCPNSGIAHGIHRATCWLLWAAGPAM